MAENTPPNELFNPANTAGQADAQQVAYRWGWTVKVYKGFNSDFTLGMKTSNVAGLSNSNVLGGYFCQYGVPGLSALPKSMIPPVYWSVLWGSKWETNRGNESKHIYNDSATKIDGDYSQVIGGTASKEVTGKEMVHGCSDKIEFYDSNCYKYIKGKESKIETNKGANDQAVFASNYSSYAIDFTIYSEAKTLTASKDITQVAGAKMTMGATTDFKASGATAEVSATNGLTLGGQSAALVGSNSVTVSSNQSAQLKVGAAGVEVSTAGVKIGPKVDMGLPQSVTKIMMPAVMDLQKQLNQLKGQMESALSESQAAMKTASKALEATLTEDTF